MVKKNQNGFSLVEALIIVAVVAAIAFIGFRMAAGRNGNSNISHEDSQIAQGTDGEQVSWNFNQSEEKWVVIEGEAPACPEPLFEMSPVEASRVSAMLYPGQYRNKDYKAHGGFGVSGGTPAKVDVVMPFDATLTGLTRYIEMGELQYIVDFLHPCGVAIRFDHLATLSPKLQAIAETTPEAKVDDTRGTPLKETIALKAGEVVATLVGFSQFESTGLDFGAYDYRQPNEIYANQTWRNLHRQYSAQHWYGVCWLNLLPKADADHIKSLKPINPQAPPEVSDYCTAPGGTTLDHNNGLPE